MTRQCRVFNPHKVYKAKCMVLDTLQLAACCPMPHAYAHMHFPNAAAASLLCGAQSELAWLPADAEEDVPVSWRVWATMTLIRWSFSRSRLHTLSHHTSCNRPHVPSKTKLSNTNSGHLPETCTLVWTCMMWPGLGPDKQQASL